MAYAIPVKLRPEYHIRESLFYCQAAGADIHFVTFLPGQTHRFRRALRDMSAVIHKCAVHIKENNLPLFHYSSSPFD